METIIFRNCIKKDNRLIFFSAREAIPVSLDSQEVAYIKIDCNKKKDGNFALLTTENNQVLIFDRADGLTIYDIVSKSMCKVPYPQNGYEVITGCKYENKYYYY